MKNGFALQRFSVLSLRYPQGRPSLVSPSIRRIQAAVASYFGCSVADMVSPSRFDEFVWPRHVAMALCKELLSHGYLTIAKAFQRDHATVIYAVHEVRRKCDVYPLHAVELEELRQLLAPKPQFRTLETALNRTNYFAAPSCDGVRKEKL